MYRVWVRNRGRGGGRASACAAHLAIDEQRDQVGDLAPELDVGVEGVWHAIVDVHLHGSAGLASAEYISRLACTGTIESALPCTSIVGGKSARA